MLRGDVQIGGAPSEDIGRRADGVAHHGHGRAVDDDRQCAGDGDVDQLADLDGDRQPELVVVQPVKPTAPMMRCNCRYWNVATSVDRPKP